MWLANRVVKRLALHVRLLSLVGGVFIISLWTVIRHINNGVNFDIVGQIGLAQQWVHGISSGAVLGQTNYVLKMPFYTLANALHFISPMNRLLILALIFNIATFIIIFLLIEKILNLQGLKDRTWFYLAALWLASISGSVYWLDYANSRNLETAGGVLLIYLAMKYMKKHSITTAALLVFASSVVFFADVLQFYVIGLGVGLYVAGKWLMGRNRQNLGQTGLIIGFIAVGYIGSKILFFLSEKLLPLSYLAVPNEKPAINLTNLAHSVRGSAVSTLNIFGGYFLKHPYGPNSLRLLLNLLILIAVLLLLARVLLHRQKQKQLAALLLGIVVANYIIYMASGQALAASTQRYLVMVPILAVIFVAVYAPTLPSIQGKYIKNVVLGMLVASSLVAIGGLVKVWPQRHAKDTYIYQTLSYMQQNNFKYALAAPGLGITATYFAQGNQVVLPVSCPPDSSVREVSLFYDKGEFELVKGYSKDVPVILQSSHQNSGADYCDKDRIISAYGQPKRERVVPGVGVAEIYDARSILIKPHLGKL